MLDSATLSGATVYPYTTLFRSYYSVLANCQAGTFATPGGTSAGSKTVAAGSVPNSDDVTLAAGTYYFRVFYGGDLKNRSAASTSADQSLTDTISRSISAKLTAT